MAGERKTGHKVIDTDAYSPAAIERLFRRKGWEATGDVSSQGCLVIDAVDRDHVIGMVKGPFWRATENIPDVSRGDLIPVFTEPKTDISHEGTNTGAELELELRDYNGDPVPAMDADGPIRTALVEHNNYVTGNGNGNGHAAEDVMSMPEHTVSDEYMAEAAGGFGNGVHFIPETDFDSMISMGDRDVGFSPELGRHALEMNFKPERDHRLRNARMVRGLQVAAQICEEHGVRITPESVMGDRDLTLEDVNLHPYVQRIALEHMTWERVSNFVGSSFQTHVEMLDLESALHATNEMQHVTHILYAGTLSGPFLGGHAEADLQAKYAQVPDITTDSTKAEAYAQLQPRQYQSYRYPGRFFGSPGGGVLPAPFPDTAAGFWEEADDILKTQESPSVGRVRGPHREFRVRPDLGPHGTIESAYPDTMGAKAEKMIALQEFTKAMGWKLQYLSKSGGMDEVRARYPALFGMPPSEDTYRVIHENTMHVAADGIEAMVMGMDGQEYPVRQLWLQLADFVNEPIHDDGNGVDYDGLPNGIMDEMHKSYLNPSMHFEDFTDPDGLTSIEGFYQTGAGTASQWMLERYGQLRARGMEERDAIKNVLVDMGTSFHTHILSITPDHLESLYQGAQEESIDAAVPVLM